MTGVADLAWAVSVVPVAGRPILRPTAVLHARSGGPSEPGWGASR